MSSAVLSVIVMLASGAAANRYLELNRTLAMFSFPERKLVVKTPQRMLGASGKCFYDPRQHATKCKHADGSVWTSAGATRPLLDAESAAAGDTTAATKRRSFDGVPVAMHTIMADSGLAASTAPAILDRTTSEEKRGSGLPHHYYHKKHHALAAALLGSAPGSSQHFNDANQGNVTWTLPPLSPPSSPCQSVLNCGGVNFRAIIADDLKPWSSSSSSQQHGAGGLSRANVEAAMAWKVRLESLFRRREGDSSKEKISQPI